MDADRGLARVEVGGDHQRVSIQMLQGGDPVVAGDWVVVHMGLAMDTISENDALETLREMAALEDPDAWLPAGEYGGRLGA